MKNLPKLKVIWEEESTPEMADRMAAAFDLLLGEYCRQNIYGERTLDSHPLKDNDD